MCVCVCVCLLYVYMVYRMIAVGDLIVAAQGVLIEVFVCAFLIFVCMCMCIYITCVYVFTQH